MSPGVSIGGIPIQEQIRNNYRVYRIVFPDPSQASTYVGDWLLRLQPTGVWSDDRAKSAQADSRDHDTSVMQPAQGRVPIGFAGAVSSDYRLAASVTTPSHLPGAALRLDAILAACR